MSDHIEVTHEMVERLADSISKTFKDDWRAKPMEERMFVYEACRRGLEDALNPEQA